MKSTLLRVVMCLMAIACLPSLSALAQTTASSASTRYESDQVLRDLLNEVRQLRADLLRLNINAHRTQTLLDRKKMQQEQVFRLTRDLDNARNELSAIRSREARTKEAIEVQEKRRAVGVVGDDEIKAMTAELQGLKEREQLLMEREPQLISELNSSQSALTQLDARLDELEREIVIQAEDQKRPQRKN